MGIPEELFNKGTNREARLDQAISDYTKALEIDPENAGAWCSGGDGLENLGLCHEAIEAYENSIKFALPESSVDVREIKGVIQELENRIWGNMENSCLADRQQLFWESVRVSSIGKKMGRR